VSSFRLVYRRRHAAGSYDVRRLAGSGLLFRAVLLYCKTILATFSKENNYLLVISQNVTILGKNATF
jgi:hypothetical protein